MVKHIQTIRRLLPSELAHFVGLALKELILEVTFDNNPLRNWYQIILLVFPFVSIVSSILQRLVQNIPSQALICLLPFCNIFKYIKY